MNARSARRLALTLILAPASCTPTPPATLAKPDTAELDRIGAYLNSLPHLQAHFVQSGDYGPGAGLVWLDRPGHLRVQYQGPAGRVMVIAGGRVRILDRATGALTTQPVSRTPLGLLLTPTLQFDGPVTVDALSAPPGGGTRRVVLSRTGQPGQGVLTLDFTDHPLSLRAVSVTDPHGHVLTLTLSDIDPAPALTPDLFAPPVAPPNM